MVESIIFKTNYIKKCSFVNTVKQVYNNHPKTVAIVDWLIVKLKGLYCKKTKHSEQTQQLRSFWVEVVPICR